MARYPFSPKALLSNTPTSGFITKSNFWCWICLVYSVLSCLSTSYSSYLACLKLKLTILWHLKWLNIQFYIIYCWLSPASLVVSPVHPAPLKSSCRAPIEQIVILSVSYWSRKCLSWSPDYRGSDNQLQRSCQQKSIHSIFELGILAHLLLILLLLLLPLLHYQISN